jgi:hypothetical protein
VVNTLSRQLCRDSDWSIGALREETALDLGVNEDLVLGFAVLDDSVTQ